MTDKQTTYLIPKKSMEFFVVFAETMKNVYESDFPEGQVPNRLRIRRYEAKIPDNRKFEGYWLVRTKKSHRIFIQMWKSGGCKRLSLSNVEIVREDTKFHEVFNSVEELNAFLDKHPEIATKLFKDVHSIRGGRIGVSVYNARVVR